MDGHGVISAAHLRDLLGRDDVRVRPLNPQSATTGSRVRQATTAPTTTATPRRPGFTTHPICRRTRIDPPPPWTRSSGPATGIAPSPGVINRPGNAISTTCRSTTTTTPAKVGTSPDELGTKCRMHHNFKTFAHGWVDDQYRDNNGRLVSEVVSPEGIRFPGPAETNTDLFPSLDPSPGTSPRPISIQLFFVAATDHRDGHRRHRPRNRTKDKHRRRRAERAANRKQRLTTEWQHAEQEYHRRREHPPRNRRPPPF